MYKVSFFRGQDETGIHALPLFGPASSTFEKTAAPQLLPDVVRYIETLRPSKESQYVLVNALGASEWWSSNINGDAFPEASLIHAPDDWTGNPLIDKARSKDWGYGYPTFYYAHPYAHHRNKDAARAFGEVELSVWNPRMRRVELVTRVDKDKCQKFGGEGVWDKLQAGQYIDVSMGCRVPYDTCSICLDWDAYRKAQATFKPGIHKTPGDAVLEVHKELIRRTGKGIRGVSITRKDYCDHALRQMNHIFPDGRKVFVYNDYPRFFDISFVFIGADKTAKVMMKIAGSGQLWSLPGAELAEKLGYDESNELLASTFEYGGEAKVAAVQDPLKLAFLGKQAKDKDAEIVKDTVPSQFAGKAVPALTANEPDLSKDMLDLLGAAPLEQSLSTPTLMGMVLRPREFQRIILIQMGMRPRADELERRGQVFPRVDDVEDVPMGPEYFSEVLGRALAPMMSMRSALGPIIEKRVTVLSKEPQEKRSSASSLSSPLLRKMAAAYNGYRRGVMELVAHAHELLLSASVPTEQLGKLATAPVETVFTPLSARYLKLAFWDEVAARETSSGVETVLPSMTARTKS
jgi:hypothetical protein